MKKGNRWRLIGESEIATVAGLEEIEKVKPLAPIGTQNGVLVYAFSRRDESLRCPNMGLNLFLCTECFNRKDGPCLTPGPATQRVLRELTRL